MKLTNETLRLRYLEDLQNPDTHHGRTTPKVRKPEVWKALTNQILTTQKPIDPFAGDVWIWSDIHFGHNNIIKYADGHRPYADKDEMNRAMIANYLAVVKPEDVVIWCGDIGFMSENQINEILDSLPGHKIWIVGNHDLHRDGKVYNLRMDERYVALTIDITDPDGFQTQFWLTHYPMDVVPKGIFNIHGHIHQNLANEWNINVCVEHTGCAPRNLRDVIAQAKNSPWRK